MSYPAIHRFIDKVRGISNAGSRDFAMPVAEAKALNAEITKLLLNLESSRESMPAQSVKPENIEVHGGDF